MAKLVQVLLNQKKLMLRLHKYKILWYTFITMQLKVYHKALFIMQKIHDNNFDIFS